MSRYYSSMQSSNDESVGKGILSIVFAIITFILVGTQPMMCNDPVGTKRVLEDQGFTNIKTYPVWFTMSEEAWVTGFDATSPAGKSVSGYCTRGWMKGTTIRYE